METSGIRRETTGLVHNSTMGRRGSGLLQESHIEREIDALQRIINAENTFNMLTNQDAKIMKVMYGGAILSNIDFKNKFINLIEKKYGDKRKAIQKEVIDWINKKLGGNMDERTNLRKDLEHVKTFVDNESKKFRLDLDKEMYFMLERTLYTLRPRPVLTVAEDIDY